MPLRLVLLIRRFVDGIRGVVHGIRHRVGGGVCRIMEIGIISFVFTALSSSSIAPEKGHRGMNCMFVAGEKGVKTLTWESHVLNEGAFS